MEPGQRDPDDSRAPDEPGADELPPLPSSLIPRWLAGVVLFALIASAVATTWLVLGGR